MNKDQEKFITNLRSNLILISHEIRKMYNPENRAKTVWNDYPVSLMTIHPKDDYINWIKSTFNINK